MYVFIFAYRCMYHKYVYIYIYTHIFVYIDYRLSTWDQKIGDYGDALRPVRPCGRDPRDKALPSSGGTSRLYPGLPKALN